MKLSNIVLHPLMSLPLAALVALLPLAAAAQPSAATVAEHVEAAKRAAGSDLGNLMGLCNAAPATRASQAEAEKGIAAQLARPAPPPGKAFDNLYYVGGAWASAWALTTSDGIVLIDALNNEAEAALQIDGGLRQLGQDPASIKTVVVTHGHGDHYGGANYLTAKYQPRFVMSDLDWRMTETQLEFATPLWGSPPKRDAQRDVSARDGDQVKQGDGVVTLLLTPGHTNGTLTPVFEVRAGGQRHSAMVWGGTAFNFGRDIPRMDAYIAATQRMAQLARAQQIDVLLSNHPGYDGTVAKLEQLRSAAGPNSAAPNTSVPNPFVMGTPAVLRALTVMGECAQAQRDRFLLMP